MKPLRGLYAVTSQQLCGDTALLLRACESALRGGASLLQYRDKRNDAATRLRHAHGLRALCRQYDALLIINDDIDLALQCAADGVHLGASDAPLAHARAHLPRAALIGITCSNSAARIEQAAAAGADYVALGRFFASGTKPDAPPATLEQLRAARARHPRLTLCAIGGITPDNAGALLAAGADLIAAVDGVFGQPDVGAAARRYCDLFAGHTPVASIL